MTKNLDGNLRFGASNVQLFYENNASDESSLELYGSQCFELLVSDCTMPFLPAVAVVVAVVVVPLWTKHRVWHDRRLPHHNVRNLIVPWMPLHNW